MDELMPGAEEVNGSLKTGYTSCEEHTSTTPEALPLGLDALHLSIVEALLLGEITDDIIKENHMMASVAADRINEAFFDEIGDNILECEDGRLSLVEEYKEDVRSLLGV